MPVKISQVEEQNATSAAPYVHSNERHSTSIAVDSIRILDVKKKENIIAMTVQ